VTVLLSWPRTSAFPGSMRWVPLRSLLIAALLMLAAAVAAEESVTVYSPPGDLLRTVRRPPGAFVRASQAADEILVRFKGMSLPTSAPAAHAQLRAAPVRTSRIVRNLQPVKLPPGVSVRQALAAYRSHPDVLYAEPN